jgi:hypothetical protein
MREAIMDHQWSSVVISGHQWSSVVISGHQWSSEVISGSPAASRGEPWLPQPSVKQSVVISGHQWSSSGEPWLPQPSVPPPLRAPPQRLDTTLRAPCPSASTRRAPHDSCVPPDARGCERLGEVVRQLVRPSEFIARGRWCVHQRSSVAISGDKWQSEALGGTRRHSMAISGTQRHSEALSGTQWHSVALSGTQQAPCSRARCVQLR